MKYLQETGIILDSFKDMLHVVDGFPGHVEFPKEVIWGLHEKSGGIVYCLAHTHPPGMTHISGEDKTTLEGWARALYPFPIRMSVTTQTNSHEFTTTVFLAIYESY